MPNALITGITGQDGAYLTKLLLDRGYHVWGSLGQDRKVHYGSLAAFQLENRVTLVPADLTDAASVLQLIEESAPDEIYNLAAQSSVARSFEDPIGTGNITGLSVTRLLEAIRQSKPDARFFQASSSEVFGQSSEMPQKETTPFRPMNPYAAAKAYAHGITVIYRESFHCHASCGILYNHESPLRGPHFVTHKITTGVARIKNKLQSSLTLGNLDVQRDWGFAGDYVDAMWRMLQQEKPDDYVIATGEAHSLQEFVDLAFQCAGLDYREYVRQDPALLRPSDVPIMIGNPTKAQTQLNWISQVSFQQLVQLLVEAEFDHLAQHGA